MRFLRLFVPLILTTPLYGQFAITVLQNGQATSVANGGAIGFNTPAIGQTIAASFSLTNLSGTQIVFPGAANLTGPNTFSGAPGPVTLSQSGVANFTISYTSINSTENVAQLLWPYNVISAVTGTVSGTGALSFTLLGTAPNVTIGQVTSNGSFVAVPSGSSFVFPETALNSSSSVTIAISNPGSGPATINTISETGAGFQLQSVPILPITLAAGSQLNIAAQFTPVASGPVMGSLQIGYGSTVYNANLSGNAVSTFLAYQITQDGKTTPLTPNQTIAIDNTNVGAKSSAVIQFQNTGSAALVLSSVGLIGTGFSVTDGPFLPTTLQPQQSASVTVTFTPLVPGASTGRLLIGNDNFLLSSSGLGPLLQYSYQAGSSPVTANPGDVISFPTLAVGQTGSVPFTITNAGTVATTLVSIGVIDTKGIFQLASLPALPQSLSPKGSVTFTMTFSPQTPGLTTTTLVINNQAFTLSGFASSPPPLPAYQFTGASGLQQPFQQPAIGLSLNAPYPIAISGTLTITIASNNFVTDPAVQFSTSGRQVAFTIPANTLNAVFPNGATQIRLQTGTVSGSITVTPDFLAGLANGTDITPASPAVLQLNVPSLSPVLLTAALGTRTTTGFSVVITGFSTTRVLQNLTFQFTPSASSGSASVGNVSATVNIAAAAAVWFQSAESEGLGSEFDVEIPFTLTSSTTVSAGTDLTKNISAVSVVVMNDVGVSNSLQVVLP